MFSHWFYCICWLDLLTKNLSCRIFVISLLSLSCMVLCLLIFTQYFSSWMIWAIRVEPGSLGTLSRLPIWDHSLASSLQWLSNLKLTKFDYSIISSKIERMQIGWLSSTLPALKLEHLSNQFLSKSRVDTFYFEIRGEIAKLSGDHNLFIGKPLHTVTTLIAQPFTCPSNV